MTTRRKQRFLRWHPRGTFAHTEHEQPAHDPPLTPHDEAVFLLHVGAEVEHALLIQYLYAACSLKRGEDLPAEHKGDVRRWRSVLMGIAREEMGHLITVQNLLRLIGGPVTLEREDYPFLSGLYPFHFRLEPLSKESLARYVLAEMPYMEEPADEILEITGRVSGEGDPPVNRVGSIYVRIAHIFSEGDPFDHLQDLDFMPDAANRQAHWADWGNGGAVLVPEVRTREEALAAIHELAEQGEGLFDPVDTPSHFQRFLDIYREFPEPGEDWQPAYDVPTDPSIAPHPGGDQAGGSISHPYARMWAQLSNMRYRMLLNYLSHFLRCEGPLVEEQGDHTPRGYLQKWTFDEMRRLGKTAAKLATLPRHEGSSERAGAPFELPYTLALPDGERDRWHAHGEVLKASLELVGRLRRASAGDASGEQFLEQLALADEEAVRICEAAEEGRPLPEQAGGFLKVVRILEDAVRGFRIGVHHNFWRGVTRDQFIELSIFDNPLIARTPNGGFDAQNSNLIKALSGQTPFDEPEEEEEGDKDMSRYPRMPAHRPPVPAQSVEYVSQWIERGCPDDDPPGQIGLEGESEPV